MAKNIDAAKRLISINVNLRAEQLDAMNYNSIVNVSEFLRQLIDAHFNYNFTKPPVQEENEHARKKTSARKR